ncbi:MAG TPA: hypothetical protein VMS76_02810, partial [Planctomycetota bacterium]|nr:hypothetical protein [Planctomycetota bacterium]
LATAQGGLPGATPRFVEARGQWPEPIRYVAQLPGMVVRGEVGAVGLQLRSASDPSSGVYLRLSFAPALRTAPEGEGELEGRFHYYIGNDPSRWVRNARSFSAIRYREAWEGVDLVLRVRDGQAKYDLEVAPGADLDRVAFACEGVEALEVDADGALLLRTALGVLRQPDPLAWQEDGKGSCHIVACRYRTIGERSYGLECPDRDPSLPLLIDPELVWSTYIGSTGGDTARALARNDQGSLVVVGRGNEVAFPLTPGAYKSPPDPIHGFASVVRLREDDGQLVYGALIGGNRNEQGEAVGVDSLGQATVAGRTESKDFPTTPGVFDRVHDSMNNAAFVLKLTPLGDDLVYSTFLEGTEVGDEAYGLALAPSGSAIVVGRCSSSDFPTTPGAFMPVAQNAGNAFVTRLAPDGNSLEWSTRLGGEWSEQAYAVVLDDQERPTVTGRTVSPSFPVTAGAFSTKLICKPLACLWMAFVTRFTADGSALVWSTLLGGSKDDVGYALALLPAGDVFVGGQTVSPDFPTTPGAIQTSYHSGQDLREDVFVARLDPSGSSLVYSTYLGGSNYDYLGGICVDTSGIATISGATESSSFPVTSGAYSTTYKNTDAFVARIDPAGKRLLYSTFLGGPSPDYGVDLVVDDTGRVTTCGDSYGPGFPVTAGAVSTVFKGGGRDAFVTQMDLLLEGVDAFGVSTPACLGTIRIGVLEMPKAGSSTFGFYASGAPPLAKGWLLLGQKRASLPPTAGGAAIWVSPLHSLVRVPVTTDVAGWVETPVPLQDSLGGSSFTAQYVFVNPPSCPATTTLSASSAVQISVQ